MTAFPTRDELDRLAILDRMTPVERSAYFAHLDDPERYPAPDIQFSTEGSNRG